MPVNTHPVLPEEVMAYLDGELTAGRTAQVSEHLKRCPDCQAVAADVQSTSRRLAEWEEAPASAELTTRVLAALADRPEEQELKRDRKEFQPLLKRPWVLVLAGGILVLLLIPTLNVWPFRPEPTATRPNVSAQKTFNSTFSEEASGGAIGGVIGGVVGQGVAPPPPPPSGVTTDQSIARTASLELSTARFEQTRGEVERIVRGHRGYIGQMNVSTPAGEARRLNASLRVPADELEQVLDALGQLGRVESEAEGSEDVTAQRVDLDARLTNARKTEQRLSDLLGRRTGNLTEVLAVEQQMDATRGQIEQMEAQQKMLSTRIVFATVELRVSEIYHASLTGGEPALNTRIRNASVQGYRTVVDGLTGLLLFALAYGPVLLVIAAVLAWPGRKLWKTLRSH